MLMKPSLCTSGLAIGLTFFTFSHLACVSSEEQDVSEEMVTVADEDQIAEDDDLDATLTDADLSDSSETPIEEPQAEPLVDEAEVEPALAAESNVEEIVDVTNQHQTFDFDPSGMVVYFGFDRADIGMAGRDTLYNLAEQLKKDDAIKIEIAGHADERGSAAYNKELGQRRAAAVRQHLMDLGVDAARLSIVSYGESRPAQAGRHAKNRRTEFAAVSGQPAT